jgi:hypothetical protein
MSFQIEACAIGIYKRRLVEEKENNKWTAFKAIDSKPCNPQQGMTCLQKPAKYPIIAYYQLK